MVRIPLRSESHNQPPAVIVPATTTEWPGVFTKDIS